MSGSSSQLGTDNKITITAGSSEASTAGGRPFVFSQSSSCQTKKEAAGWISEKEGSAALKTEASGSDFQLITAWGGSGKVDNDPQRSTWKVHSFLLSSRTQVDQFCRKPSLKKTIGPQKTACFPECFFCCIFLYTWQGTKKQGEQELVSEGGSNTRLRGAVTNLADSVPLVTSERMYF